MAYPEFGHHKFVRIHEIPPVNKQFRFSYQIDTGAGLALKNWIRSLPANRPCKESKTFLDVEEKTQRDQKVACLPRTINANLVAPFERWPCPWVLSPSLKRRHSFEISIFFSRLTNSPSVCRWWLLSFWKSYWLYAFWGLVAHFRPRKLLSMVRASSYQKSFRLASCPSWSCGAMQSWLAHGAGGHSANWTEKCFII